MRFVIEFLALIDNVDFVVAMIKTMAEANNNIAPLVILNIAANLHKVKGDLSSTLNKYSKSVTTINANINDLTLEIKNEKNIHLISCLPTANCLVSL